MAVKLTFLGAAGTVTGSKYLLELKLPRRRLRRILIDAGIFQGERRWREENWRDPPTSLLSEIDACILTHAHIDHTGILPRYHRLGLRCPVYCTRPTADLTQILLRDSARLQEEDARYRQKLGRSRHSPPLPLYTVEDAEAALERLTPVPFGKRLQILPGIEAEWHHMGHILGAASVVLSAKDLSLCFSGDVGRYSVPILRDPEGVELGSLLLIESTYGNRDHGTEDPAGELARVVNAAVKRGGALIIPSFAVGRTQTLLFFLRELKESQRIPDIPVIIDSPMAQDVTGIYSNYPGDYDEQAVELVSAGQRPFSPAKLYFTRDREESKRLNSINEPMIIISASGMLSGGRILHHLFHRLPDPRNTVLFVGFQPPGSRGDRIKSGSRYVQILNQDVAVRAAVEEISAMSAHADRGELLRWCRSCSGKPAQVAVVHGEPEAASALQAELHSQMGWKCTVAKYREEMEI